MKIKALKKERTTIKEAIEAWSRRSDNDKLSLSKKGISVYPVKTASLSLCEKCKHGYCDDKCTLDCPHRSSINRKCFTVKAGQACKYFERREKTTNDKDQKEKLKQCFIFYQNRLNRGN